MSSVWTLATTKMPTREHRAVRGLALNVYHCQDTHAESAAKRSSCNCVVKLNLARPRRRFRKFYTCCPITAEPAVMSSGADGRGAMRRSYVT